LNGNTAHGSQPRIAGAPAPRPASTWCAKGLRTRTSGFADTGLEDHLRSAGIRNLLFTGIATNVCVESTARDAFSPSLAGADRGRDERTKVRTSTSRRPCGISSRCSAGCQRRRGVAMLAEGRPERVAV
jgi:hypothetical protein